MLKYIVMKIKDGFKIENLAGENFIVATGSASSSFKDTIVLNETASYIFEKLKNNISIDTLVSEIVKEYDVDKALAMKDAQKTIDTFKLYNILEEQ